MLAALYGRCSTNKQELSIDAQNSTLRAYAQLHHLTLDESAVVLEDDTSGSIPFAKRKKGSVLLKLIEARRQLAIARCKGLAADEPAAGPITDLIVPKIDRLGRNGLDTLNTLDRLKNLGVRVHVVDLGGCSFDTSSALGGMIIAVLSYASQIEVESIRDRITKSFSHKRTRSELCGTPPYGFDATDTGRCTSKGKPIRVLLANEHEQRWLRQMWEWRRAGWAFNRIARELNRCGVPTKEAGRIHNLKAAGPQAATAGWQCGNVNTVLKNSYTKVLITQWIAEANSSAPLP